LLSKIRLKVLENIVNLAPCTSTELHKHMLGNYGMNGSWRVLTYLRDVGVLYETGTRKCRVTGREVIEWDMTDNLPSRSITKGNGKPKGLKSSIKYISKHIRENKMPFITLDELQKL